MKSCPYCGHEVLKTDCYCPECGHVSRPQISLDKYNLGLIENFKQCLVYKYADFDGRASRSEYWHFLLVYQLLFVDILFTCAFLSYIRRRFWFGHPCPFVRDYGYSWRGCFSATSTRSRPLRGTRIYWIHPCNRDHYPVDPYGSAW